MSPPKIPSVSFANNLDSTVTVYDSFSKEDKANFFGTLTSIATVPANTTSSVQLLHPTSVLIVSNATTNVPVARFIYSKLLDSTGPFAVTQADVDAMNQTIKFITFIIDNPKDSLASDFNAIWKDNSKPQVKLVNQFFAKHTAYGSCTFATYMMGVTYMASLPKSKGKPMEQAMYSLSTVVTLLGGTWPSGIPDIVVTKFTCNTLHDVLYIRAEIDLKKLPAQSDQALQFFGSLFQVHILQVAFSFNHSFSLGALGTRLSISLDTMKVPFGDSVSLAINKPTVTIDIQPLFKFVVFTVTGIIPFNVFGKAFEADVSMLIDNIQANFGVVIKGGNGTSLPAPPVMKGVHFDEFGVGIGIIFEPPGAALGLSGKLHIGELEDGTMKALADDTFVVVCELVEEVPNPLYASFYVPQMHLTDVLKVFTNTQSSIDVPVSFTDLSFQWSENPMAPVALPDGSLSKMGYGFSAGVNIASFSFYGDIEMNINNGLTADIEMSPVTLGNVFAILGDGSGVSIKVDASGNPVKNNLLATTAARQKALKDSTTKQLVPSGGPVLKIQTFASPFLHLNASVKLFEVETLHLDADINSSGIHFEVGFGGLLKSNVICTLADWHNLAASFQFGIDKTISLPSISGVSLGSLPLVALANVHFSLNTSSSNLIFSVRGNFDFEGITRTFGDFTVDVYIQHVSELLSAIVTYIEKNVEHLFNELVISAANWARKVKDGLIKTVDSIASVLHNAFDQDARQIAATMRDAGFALDVIAGELKQIFDPEKVADALKDAFNLSVASLALVMQQVGYAGEDVAKALKTVFGDEAEEIATALSQAYSWSADQIHTVLTGIGFTADQIANAFEQLGGEFGKVADEIKGVVDQVVDAVGGAVEDVVNDVGNALDPGNWF
jgi:NACalpha-BTF3-like transcription factor